MSDRKTNAHIDLQRVSRPLRHKYKCAPLTIREGLDDGIVLEREGVQVLAFDADTKKWERIACIGYHPCGEVCFHTHCWLSRSALEYVKMLMETFFTPEANIPEEPEWPRVFCRIYTTVDTWVMESERVGKYYVDYKYKDPSTMSCAEFSSPELHGQERLDVLRKIAEANKPEAHGTPFHESTQPEREWPVYTTTDAGGVWKWSSNKEVEYIAAGWKHTLLRSFGSKLQECLSRDEDKHKIITEAEARSITGPKKRKVLGYRYTGACLPYDACPDDCYYTDSDAVALLQKHGGRPTEWCYLMKKIEKPAKKYWSMKESMGQYWLANEGGELVAMSPREDIMRVIVDKLNGTP